MHCCVTCLLKISLASLHVTNILYTILVFFIVKYNANIEKDIKQKDTKNFA